MLIRTLRPRWKVKYLFCTTIALCVLWYLLLSDMPLLSSRLPPYSGPYQVGVIDIEAPCEKRSVADAVFKESGKPAFELETVLFSLYYPAAKELKEAKPHHKWVSNVAQHAEGYARFARVNNHVTTTLFEWALWALVGSTTVPANVDAPIHGGQGTAVEQPPDGAGLPQYPVIVFSHGQASSRTSYTHYCGELASRGFVVAAVEHRDGSGPGSEISYKDGRSTRDIFHISESQLDPQPEEAELKVMQLAMRQAEVEETVRVLKQINQGSGVDIFNVNSREEGSGLAEWKDRLDERRFVVGGHSYGATLALQALKGSPTNERRPFIGGIILDPGKHSGPLNDDIDVPIIIINSQSWSSKFSIFHGRPHFEVVKDLVKTVMRKKATQKPIAGWFLTSKGTTHPSVTDAPLIEPVLLSWTTGSTINAREGVLQYVKVSAEFMRYLEDGKRTGVLAEDVTHPEYDQDARSEERMEEMDRSISKYWQIHVSPDSLSEVESEG